VVVARVQYCKKKIRGLKRKKEGGHLSLLLSLSRIEEGQRGGKEL